MYIDHPIIKPNTIESRIYQQLVVANALKKNTLCVLGTGLGKTAIAALTIAGILSKKDGKILIIAPSRPLVEQHYRSMTQFLNIGEDNIMVLTGKTPPSKREALWKKGKVFITTPQIVENDIIASRINIDDFVLLIADEAHHTTGNHSYTFVASKFKEKTHVLGLTASPGSNIDRILEVCENLGIEHVEIKTEDDNDVKPYVAKVKLRAKRVDLPEEFEENIKLLRSALKDRLRVLKDNNIIFSINVTKTELLGLQKKIMALDDNKKYELVKIASEALKIEHAIEVLETQGKSTFLNYYERLKTQNTKSAKSILNDARILKVVNSLQKLDIEHPKLDKLAEIVEEILKTENEKVIVFAQYRDTVCKIVKNLKDRGIDAIMFVGQSNKDGKGMTQKEQVKAIEEFKNNVDVLVSTSVSEEGIDISSVNYVIFYEPVPSEIRFIQRRGRAARGEGGEVIILITRNSRDEGYYRSAISKEKNMKKILKDMQRILNEKLKEREQEKRLEKQTLWQDTHQEVISEVNEITKSEDLEKRAEQLGYKNEDKKKKEEYKEHAKKTVQSELRRSEEQRNAKHFVQLTTGTGRVKGEYLDLRNYGTGIEKADSDSLLKKNEKDNHKIKIIVDTRERHIGRYLVDKANIEFKTLEIGDYVLSDRVAVERKIAEDFAESIIDKRLFKQLSELKKYEKPILIIEGNEFNRLHQNVIQGTILSIILDFGIPVLFSKDIKETANILIKIAEREQLKEKRAVSVRYGKRPMSLRERQKFIVESLPEVGPALAESLLLEFKSIEKIFNANKYELMKVEGIGEKTAKKIREVITKEYNV